MDGRGAVYTAITGGKDVLRPLQYVIPDVEYICFTDDPSMTAEGWTCRPLDYNHRDPTRRARRPKILAHQYLKDFDWSLWIDGNFEITGHIEAFIMEHVSEAAFHAFKHNKRAYAYEEFPRCKELEKDDPVLIDAQEARYRAEGMPEDRRLLYSGVLLRRHNDPEVKAAMKLWWSEIKRGSRRDQLSLPYVLWKQPVDFRVFGTKLFWNQLPFIQRKAHQIKKASAWRR